MSGTCAKFTGGDRKHNARGRWSVGKKVRLIEPAWPQVSRFLW